MVTPAVKREAVAHLKALFGLSERRACRIAGADRKMVRYQAQRAPDTVLRGRLRELANERRRFGYRRLFVLLRRDGEANRFVLHIMAAVAEQEGRAISERTKAALAAAKARGVKLGWSIPERASEQRQAARKGAAVNRARALAHAENVLPVIEQIRAGAASLRQIAAELNTRGIKTARGGKWHATTVRNVLA